MVDGLFFCPTLTSRPQRRPNPICTSRSGNVRHRCGGGWPWNPNVRFLSR